MPRLDPGDVVRRRLRWPLEAAGFAVWLGICALLPVEAASNMGGRLGRAIGPRTGLTRRAERNLRLAMPELSAAARARILADMWENLGRTAAEYAHLRTISDPQSGRVECVGLENVRATIDGRRPAVAFSGHLANWEVLPLMTAALAPGAIAIAREPNNRLVGALLEGRRAVRGGRRVSKGAEGARAALATLRAKGLVALLVDQRMSDGIEVPFFGRPAMTAPAAAQLALRFGAAIHPVRLERLGPARFRMTVLPPLDPPRAGSRHGRVAALMEEVNRILEGWIRERPGEWLWLHRRWPKDADREIEG